MKQIIKKGKAGGSVLLTVVGVMMVMVVFLMTTLGLSASSHQRSYYRYYEKQAQYAAQAALDTVTNSAYTNTEFVQWLMSHKTKNEPLSIDVELTGTDIQFDNMHSTPGGENIANISCIAEYEGEVVIWDDKSGKMYRMPSWKLTATARVGRGKNLTEHSVTNHLYQNYPNNSGTADRNSVTFETNYFGDPQPEPAGGSKASAIYSMGANDGSNGNMKALGPISNGMGYFPRKDGPFSYRAEQPEISLKNNPLNADDCYFNGHLYTRDESKIYFQHNGVRYDWPEGLTVMGDLVSDNDKTFYLYTDLPEDEVNATKNYNKLNYVYVDGQVRTTGGGFKFGAFGSAESPLNLYAGSIAVNNDNTNFNGWYGDMFLHDPTATSGLKFANNGSNLTQFVSKNINKANYTGDYIASDVISNNLGMQIKCRGGKDDIAIGGDLIMSNPNSTLTIDLESGSFHVAGSIVCAGSLLVKCNSNDKHLTADGGIYVDPAKVTFEGNSGNVNEIGWGQNANTEYRDKKPDANFVSTYFAKDGLEVSTTAKTYRNNSTKVHVESLGIDATGTDYADTFKNLRAAANDKITSDSGLQGTTYLAQLEAKIGSTDYKSYDYSLYPFCSRQDEIFEKFVRWDIWVNDQGEYGRDNYMKESEAANHTYQSYQPLANNTTFMACTPHDLANHSFIKTREYGGVQDYFDSTGDFGTGYPTTTYDFAKAKQKKVNIGCHNGAGEYVTPEIGNFYVIEESCILDLSMITANEKDRLNIFVNPQGGQITLGIKNKPGVDEALNIIVNNTVQYGKLDSGAYDYTNAEETKSLTSLKTKAGRENLRIFFEDSFSGCNKMNVYCTGIYQQLKEGHMYVVSNPFYPDQEEWSKAENQKYMTGAWKYAHELVPNIRIYGEKGLTMSFTNQFYFHAEVLMPEASFVPQTTSGMGALSYRENIESVAVEVADGAYLTIGSACVESLGINDAKGMAVYIGDNNRDMTMGEPPETAGHGGTSSGNDLGSDYSLSDMYQGAS